MKRTNYFEINNDPVWKIKKVETQEELGPFRYFEIIGLIQKKIFQKTDLICKNNHDEWKRICNIYEFNEITIKNLIQMEDNDKKRIFLPRKHIRATYLCPVVLQTNNKKIHGRCSSISEGGCFIEVSSDNIDALKKSQLSLFMPDIDKTIINVPNQNGKGAQMISGNIVYVSVKGVGRTSGIGIKFLNLHSNTCLKIRSIIRTYQKNSRTARK